MRAATVFLLSAGLVTGAIYFDILAFMETRWRGSPDYSHGYLVAPFVAAILWWRLSRLPTTAWTASPSAIVVGVLLIAIAAVVRGAGIYMRTVTLEALSLIPCLGGVTLICGGWQVARQAWAPVAFLVFMVPLPLELSTLLSSALQRVATQFSTFSLQLFGIPAVAQGNVIRLTSSTIGVAEACSGIRMLVSFISLTVGACLLVERPLWEKLFLVATAPLIALAANVIRIVSTGVAFETAGEQLGRFVFHDLAGWLMMPIGLGLLLAEMSLLSRLLIEPESRVVPRAAKPSTAAV